MTASGLDTYLEILADERRRQVIQRLRTDGDSTLEELATSVDGEHAERLADDLHHNHLPRLAAHGIVEYDTRSGYVRYDPDPELEAIVDAVLAVASATETPIRED